MPREGGKAGMWSVLLFIRVRVKGEDEEGAWESDVVIFKPSLP